MPGGPRRRRKRPSETAFVAAASSRLPTGRGTQLAEPRPLHRGLPGERAGGQPVPDANQASLGFARQNAPARWVACLCRLAALALAGESLRPGRTPRRACRAPSLSQTPSEPGFPAPERPGSLGCVPLPVGRPCARLGVLRPERTPRRARRRPACSRRQASLGFLRQNAPARSVACLCRLAAPVLAGESLRPGRAAQSESRNWIRSSISGSTSPRLNRFW